MHSVSNLQGLDVPKRVRSSVSFEDLNNTRFKQVLTEGKDDCSKSSDSVDLITSDEALGKHNSVDKEAVKSGTSASAGNNRGNSGEDDDDCIVFGRPDVPAGKLGDSGVGQSVNDSVLRQSVGEAKSDSLPDGAKSGHSLREVSSSQRWDESKSGQPPVGTEPSQSSDGAKPDQSLADEKRGELSKAANPESVITTNGVDSNRKRKVKKKGLAERLKARAKKAEGVKDDIVAEKGEEEGTANSLVSGQDSQESEPGHEPEIGSDQPPAPAGRTVSAGSGEQLLAVCLALAATEYSDDVWKRAGHIEVNFSLLLMFCISLLITYLCVLRFLL